LLWELTWGKEIETLLAVWKEFGVKPKALQNRPTLKESDRHYIDAFYDLSAGRSIGEVIQPIGIRDIQAYCEMFGVTGTARENLFRVIRHLDATYLKHKAEKQ
jgi:hypothetical protein